MRKNKMMRLASALLVAVLLTTCAISGTFAKYVTEGTSTDTARVAKWGVTITAANKMFADAYKDAEATWTADENVDTITVQAKTAGTKVVAPGTQGEFVDFTVAGSPEVDVQVTYTANLSLTNWTAGGEYCPIVFTVNSETYSLKDMGGTNESDTIAELETAIETAIINSAKKYHTNQNLSAVATDLNVSWAWAFETGADDAAKAANNVKDTALGNAATAPEISLTVGVTITQVD